MRLFTAIITFFLCLLPAVVYSQEWKTTVDLRGQWKFEVGDDMYRTNTNYDDRKWDQIFVPAKWEDEGYPGYDGYAWYRKHFKVPATIKGRELYLNIGYVDDACEVYLNGHMIGFVGSFPPHFVTAYSVYQRYAVPQQYLNFNGDNVIAVRVYDSQLEGGMVNGKVGLVEMVDYLYPDMSLAGTWKFKHGDNEEWSDPTLDDSSWRNIVVPTFWEGQGYEDYNGYGWYRIHFRVPPSLRNQRLMLLLGRIDDVDEAFLNGERIGRTGALKRGKLATEGEEEYLRLRVYNIPSGALQFDRENVLAVRVLDTYMHGGIYDGPVGIITQERYRAWYKRQPEEQRNKWNLFDFLFKD